MKIRAQYVDPVEETYTPAPAGTQTTTFQSQGQPSNELSPCSMSSNIIHGPMEIHTHTHTHTHTHKNRHADKELRELTVDVFYFVLIMIMGT